MPAADAGPGDFDAFYAAEWPNALRLATLLTQQRSVAEDLAQQAFTNVRTSWARVERPAAYLTTAVVNACRTWHRKEQRARERLPLLLTDEAAHAAFPELSDALADLPYRQRAVIVLRFYAGLSEPEIADALDCRPGTVKSLASRGLDSLRKAISV